ncbi:speckle targeted PIP5K1A-regulated poly(A) polymerase [Parasteatoda tepidariorum]|uniref:speckle targeted PIP5K1A-regulated poly(A) polymerase n=1 Tax=Parasteatoda tepidariorum TaxID=114398 RepID=UPI001C71899F|nr:speckle targeted PIP5K1A-regulated poly(A) polymerase isoform X1 [Parasteatoda tepidariorum]
MIHTMKYKSALTSFCNHVGHGRIFGSYAILCQNNPHIERKMHRPFLQISSNISTSPDVLKVHTIKGWKTIAATGVKLKARANSDDFSSACEEGSNAILHSDLIAELQNCNSVSSQIAKFCSLMSLSDEDRDNRTLFCKSLEDMFKIYFTNFKLHQFGSSVNGLGFKGCDVDVCLQTLFYDENYVTLKDVPTLDSVLDGSVSQETLSRLTPLYMLRFVRRILRRHGTADIKEPILFIKARCPILRFYNAKYDVFCDFSCESENSLRNTRVLRLICQLDERFVVLAKLVRYWGKYGGFVGDIDRFNSYAFSLFVIYFLQNVHPPVLPPLQEIIDKSNYLKTASVADVSVMIEDLKNFKPSENTTPAEKLLRDFFFFYLNFDFERVLLPYSGSSVHKSEFSPVDNSGDNFMFGTVSIQDPFRHSYNATTSANFKYCVKFMSSLVQVCDIYQDSENWLPETEMWGLCSLLKPPTNEIKLSKELQEKHTHQIRLKVIPGAALKLRSIFEHGLLFQCKEFSVDSNSSKILKLQCRVYRNTWQGRDVVFHKYQNSESELLEIEHMVSKEIIKNKTESRREILAEFMFECQEVEAHNGRDLILNFNFTGKKFPYVLIIFLKEYVPHIYNKMG